ncbi:MAG: GxxExxY protein [Polaromonas sp.]
MSAGEKLPSQRREDAKDAKEKNATEINRVSAVLVDAALEVHREFGPGLLESAYCAALTIELEQRGESVVREREVPCFYKGTVLGISYRMDMVVNACVIVEVKAVQELLPIHHAQLLTYLRLSGHKLGLLINFNVPLLKGSIKRVVNRLRLPLRSLHLCAFALETKR